MAPKKEYGWVDYANLTLNVVQTAQLENVRHQLAQLQQVHLDERAKAQIRDQLRQKVFEIEQALKELSSLADKTPLQTSTSGGALVDECGNVVSIGPTRLPAFVYMNCSQLKDYCLNTGIGPASFSDFNDKDRVQKVLLELDEAINKTYEQLDSSSRKEVDECRRFIEEETELQDFIGCLKNMKENEVDPNDAQSELVRNQAELNKNEKLYAELKPAWEKGRQTTGCVAGLVILVSWIAAFIVIGMTNDDDDAILTLGLFIFLLFGIPFLAIFLAKNKTRNEEVEFRSMHPGVDMVEIDKQITFLKNRCSKLQTCLEEAGKLYATFGRLSEAEAIALQKQRQERVAKTTSFTTV
ncbi:MAG: hypothetical protein ABSF10_04750 [Verrucomicrobiota bacterium]|jgi:hypothetical protein